MDIRVTGWADHRKTISEVEMMKELIKACARLIIILLTGHPPY